MRIFTPFQAKIRQKSGLFLGILSLLCLSACSDEKPQKQAQTVQSYKVAKTCLHKTLHFNGLIEPRQQTGVISPVDAVVETVVHPFGEWVEKDDIVWVLHSTDLQKQYNDSLTEYLKAKDSFWVAKAKFSGTHDLYDAGLVSKNAYLSEKSNLDTQQVNLEQTQNRFTTLLKKTDSQKTSDLQQLNLADFDKVRRALALDHQRITLKAPATGLMLYPPKSSDKEQALAVGASVKAGQVVALIGDLSGIRVAIEVPEVDIDQIHRGMSATVTGIALGQDALKAEVVAVNGQAINNSSGLPSFTATVEVKHLNKRQHQRIRVGMSATVDLAIDQSEALAVPIEAIHQHQGQAAVTLIKQGQAIETLIKTGSAQQDKVIVLSGLAAGDEIRLAPHA